MELILQLGPFIITAIVAVLGLVLIKMIKTLNKLSKKNEEYQEKFRVMQVTVDNPILPDGHIIKHKPTPWTLAGKVLYMQPLKFEQHRIFTERMIKFLSKYLTQLKGLKFLLISDLLDKNMKDQMIKDWSAISSNSQIFESMLDMIEITFLADKNINPNKLTRKEIVRKCTWMEILQTWQFLYAINVDCVESFINALLTPTKTGPGSVKVGSLYENQQDSRLKNSQTGTCQPRYSWYEERQSEIKNSMKN